jgi:hypothetical protein
MTAPYPGGGEGHGRPGAGGRQPASDVSVDSPTGPIGGLDALIDQAARLPGVGPAPMRSMVRSGIQAVGAMAYRSRSARSLALRIGPSR